jgi:hypothetical protein
MRESRGTISLSSSTRFVARSTDMKLVPVTLPPGRERLLTISLSTGSRTAANTIGPVRVRSLAATAAGVADARMTLTFRRSSSEPSSAS